MHTHFKPLRRPGPCCSQPDRKHRVNGTFRRFDFHCWNVSERVRGVEKETVYLLHLSVVRISPQRFWMDWTQVNSDEWQEQLETIQAPANSKVAFACYSCTAASSHSLPLHRSLARSQSPTRFTLTPTTLSLSASLSFFSFFSPSFSVSQLSFTYLMSFNCTTLTLAMSRRKCQANLFLANFFKMSQIWKCSSNSIKFFFFFSGQSTSCISCGKTIIVVVVAIFNLSQFPMWHLQNCSFVHPTVQNTNTLNFILWITKKSSTALHLKSWNYKL